MMSLSLTDVANVSHLIVTGVALAVASMITQFGSLAAPNRAGGMALNGFVLFVGASIGPFIAGHNLGFVTLLVVLSVALMLAAVSVAGSASVASSARTS